MGRKSTATIDQKQVMADLLQAYMDKRGWGPTQAAQEIGVARTTLNAWTSLTSLPRRKGAPAL